MVEADKLRGENYSAKEAERERGENFFPSAYDEFQAFVSSCFKR